MEASIVIMLDGNFKAVFVSLREVGKFKFKVFPLCSI